MTFLADFENFDPAGIPGPWCLKISGQLFGPFDDYKDVLKIISALPHEEKSFLLDLIWHEGMNGWDQIFSFYTENPPPALTRPTIELPVPIIQSHRITNAEKILSGKPFAFPEKKSQLVIYKEWLRVKPLLDGKQPYPLYRLQCEEPLTYIVLMQHAACSIERASLIFHPDEIPAWEAQIRVERGQPWLPKRDGSIPEPKSLALKSNMLRTSPLPNSALYQLINKRLTHLSKLNLDQLSEQTTWAWHAGDPYPIENGRLHFLCPDDDEPHYKEMAELHSFPSDREAVWRAGRCDIRVPKLIGLTHADGRKQVFDTEQGFIGPDDFVVLRVETDTAIPARELGFMGLREPEWDKTGPPGHAWRYDHNGDRHDLPPIALDTSYRGYSHGHYGICSVDERNRVRIAIVDMDEELKTDFIWTDLRSDYAGFWVCDAEGKWGRWNPGEGLIIKPRFDTCPKSHSGCYIAQEESLHGLISGETFKIIVPPRFVSIDLRDRIDSSDKATFQAKDINGSWTVYDRNGKLLFGPLKMGEAPNGVTPISVESRAKILKSSSDNEEDAWSYELWLYSRSAFKRKVTKEIGAVQLNGSSLSPLRGKIGSDRSDQITALGLSQQRVVFIEPVEGLGTTWPKGTTGRIGKGALGYTMGGMFDYRVELPIHGLDAKNPERTLGVPYEKLSLLSSDNGPREIWSQRLFLIRWGLWALASAALVVNLFIPLPLPIIWVGAVAFFVGSLVTENYLKSRRSYSDIG